MMLPPCNITGKRSVWEEYDISSPRNSPLPLLPFITEGLKSKLFNVYPPGMQLYFSPSFSHHLLILRALQQWMPGAEGGCWSEGSSRF